MFPKYRPGQELFYVNPFVFIIDKILIKEIKVEENGDYLYVEAWGAPLHEYDLFDNLEDAQNHARVRLRKFFNEHLYMIAHCKPELHLPESEDEI